MQLMIVKKKMIAIILIMMFTVTACGQEEAVHRERGEMAASEKVLDNFIESEEAGKAVQLEGSKEVIEETIKETVELITSVKTTDAEAPEPAKASTTENDSKSTDVSKRADAEEPVTKPSESREPEQKKEIPTPVPSSEPEQMEEIPTSAPSSEWEQKEETPATVHTSCSWDSGNVTTLANCNSTGVKIYTCTVCGNTRAESVPATSHNYVTDTTEATCTEAGKIKTYCSICGNVQAETVNGEAAGHDYRKEYWPAPPTCFSGADYIMKCTKCGVASSEEYQREGALPHIPVATEIYHGNCITPTIIVNTCSNCGFEIDREGYFEDEHDWVTGTYEELNVETLEWEIKTVTYCTRCSKQQ